MPSRRAPNPEPEYVVLCSDAVDWQSDTETIAACGHPILLHASSDRDLDFAHQLASKHKLQSFLDHAAQTYLLWKADRAPLPRWPTAAG